MNKRGIYRGGKVYYRQPVVIGLTGGNWEKGWSGTKSFGGNLEKYDVINTIDWWPCSNQEVEFEIINGRAMIRGLGKMYDQDTADILCSGNFK